jgi:hypothetical protein
MKANVLSMFGALLPMEELPLPREVDLLIMLRRSLPTDIGLRLRFGRLLAGVCRPLSVMVRYRAGAKTGLGPKAEGTLTLPSIGVRRSAKSSSKIVAPTE